MTIHSAVAVFVALALLHRPICALIEAIALLIGDLLDAMAARVSGWRAAKGEPGTHADRRNGAGVVLGRMIAQLIVAVLFVAFLAMDREMVLLSLQAIFGTGGGSTFADLDQLIAIGVLFTVAYGGWHLAEATGASVSLAMRVKSASWRRVHTIAAIMAIVGGFTSGILLAVHRGWALSDRLAFDEGARAALTTASLPISVHVTTYGVLISLVVAITLVALLSFEAGFLPTVFNVPIVALFAMAILLDVLRAVWRASVGILLALLIFIARVGLSPLAPLRILAREVIPAVEGLGQHRPVAAAFLRVIVRLMERAPVAPASGGAAPVSMPPRSRPIT